MDFMLSEENKMLQTTVRDFATNKLAPMADELDRNEEFPRSHFKAMAEMGLLGLTIPTEYGGGGGIPNMTMTIITEELAKGDSGMSSVVGMNAGSTIMPAVMANNKAVLDRFVPPFLIGNGDGYHHYSSSSNFMGL